MGTGRLGMTSTNSNRNSYTACHPWASATRFLPVGPELQWLNLLLLHLQSIQMLQTTS